MKIKEMMDRFGEMDVSEAGTFLKFMGLVIELDEGDQKIIADLFELLGKKIGENFVRKKKLVKNKKQNEQKE